MVTLHEIAQGTTQWHEAREGKFTGSNAYKLLRFGAVGHAKAQQTSFKGNHWTRRGHSLEKDAIELYEKINSTPVLRIGFVTNDRYPDCLYSPDGLTDTHVIEVKCFDEPKHMAIYNGDIPAEIMAQIQFGMMITDRKLAHLVILNHELDPTRYTVKHQFRIIPIKANKNIHDNFRRILRRGVPIGS